MKEFRRAMISPLEPTEVQIPRGPVREYLIAFGVAAVYVATLPTGEPCIVGVTRDLEKTRFAIRRSWHWAVDITLAFWVRDRASAKRIARAVNADLAHHILPGRLAVTAERAGRAIRAEAAGRGITLTDHDTAMARVHASVDRVAAMLDEAQANGGLKWFNRGYREWREAARANGLGMSYAEAKARLRRALVVRAAKGGEIAFAPNLLAEILPPINNRKARELAPRIVDHA
jgi:hypothetical protein